MAVAAASFLKPDADYPTLALTPLPPGCNLSSCLIAACLSQQNLTLFWVSLLKQLSVFFIMLAKMY